MSYYIIKPQADTDIDEITAYFESEVREDIAVKFLRSFNATIEKLIEYPRMGHHLDPGALYTHDVRILRVDGFESWLIFYRPLEDGIEIIRVLHGAHDLPHEFEITDW